MKLALTEAIRDDLLIGEGRRDGPSGNFQNVVIDREA
jgi:hypothetical protein